MKKNSGAGFGRLLADIGLAVLDHASQVDEMTRRLMWHDRTLSEKEARKAATVLVHNADVTWK